MYKRPPRATNTVTVGGVSDGLVKAIFVYDDYIKLILTFDDKPINIPTTEEIEYMANSSDIQSSLITWLIMH